MIYFFGGSEITASSWDECREALAGLGISSLAVSYDLSLWEHGYEHALETLEETVTSGSVLVGHSIAGLFLPVLGERIGAVAEIYLCALVPQPGVSFVEQLFEDGGEVFTPEWSRQYFSAASATDPSVEDLLFGDCPSGSATRFQRPPQDPSYLYNAPCPLGALPPRRRIHFAGRHDRTLLHGWQRHAASKWLGVDAFDLDTGHLPQISAPRQLATTLARALGKLGS
ncbi:MAG TPA: alpha/beta fold hydrolase [Chthoniobacterales bacterium]|nr:alpha/beta fold hydrolase [Chthoniobacterales bacterium]